MPLNHQGPSPVGPLPPGGPGRERCDAERGVDAGTCFEVCATVLAALGSPKDPVERPLKVRATAVWVVSLVDGRAEAVQEAEATHAGHFRATGWGI
jgi:hypothetical protein